MGDTIMINEQKFQENYEQGSEGFEQIPFEECTLDFIPVSGNCYDIFDKEKQEFLGSFLMDEVPVQGKEPKNESILYTDTWDFRKMLPEEIVTEKPERYWNLMQRLHQKRISDFISKESRLSNSLTASRRGLRI